MAGRTRLDNVAGKRRLVVGVMRPRPHKPTRGRSSRIRDATGRYPRELRLRANSQRNSSKATIPLALMSSDPLTDRQDGWKVPYPPSGTSVRHIGSAHPFRRENCGRAREKLFCSWIGKCYGCAVAVSGFLPLRVVLGKPRRNFGSGGRF